MLADKIISERKRAGLNQEELADKLGVSRQAVSKWESAQSTPDLTRIVDMAKIFGCTTDYLLKDDCCEKSAAVGESEAKPNGVKSIEVSDEAAREYLVLKKKTSKSFAVATMLCVLSPALLVFMAGLSEYSGANISEGIAVTVGLTALFLLVATAVFIFVFYGIKLNKFGFISKQSFTVSKTIESEAKKKLSEFEKKFVVFLSVGVVLCVIAVLPLIISGAVNAGEVTYTSMTALLLVIISVGVALIVRAAIEKSGYDALLERGDYSKAAKKANKAVDAVCGAYWPLVTAGYLAWSFIGKSWGISWIVWPIAAVAYAAIMAIVKAFVKSDYKED